MRNFFAVSLLLSSSLAQADSFANLKRTLAGFEGRQPIDATLAFTHSQLNGDDAGKPSPPLTVHADVAANAAGVRLEFPRRMLDLANAESRLTDPEAKKPVGATLSQILVTDVDEYLNAAPKLLAPLERAKVLGEKTEVWRGQPVRVISLKLNPLLGKQQLKYVKKLDATAKVWISADGVPLAAEQHYVYSGRAMLVINFESATHESFEYQKRGDRLVVVRHRREDTSSGGGESGTRKIDARLTLAPAPTAATQALRLEAVGHHLRVKPFILRWWPTASRRPAPSGMNFRCRHSRPVGSVPRTNTAVTRGGSRYRLAAGSKASPGGKAIPAPAHHRRDG